MELRVAVCRLLHTYTHENAICFELENGANHKNAAYLGHFICSTASRVPANIVGIKLRFRIIIRCLPLALLLKAGRVKLYPNEVRQRDAKNGSRMSG